MFFKITKLFVLLYLVLTLPFFYFTFRSGGVVGESKFGKVALVLGAGIDCALQAQVLVCKPSEVLKNRLDKALELYNSGQIKKILVSGNGQDFYHNETKVMSNYLQLNNISVADIYADYDGNDTQQSCENAKNVFKLNKVLIVTQAFHLSRSIFLCRKAGLKVNAQVASDSSLVTTNYGLLREIPASWKALGLNLGVD
jgi:vancomycin permeability regulator SanA